MKAKLADTFSRFRPFPVLVVGDFMFDSYTTGRVKRISPEAPVPVMEVLKQEARPGGAGNVALNLNAIGGQVFAVGRIGADRNGDELRACLIAQGIDVTGLCVDPTYHTPLKNRLIAESQQLLRVDHETIVSPSPAFENQILEILDALIPKVQVVALSDYGKGFLTPKLISASIAKAKEAQVPIIIDPKGIDFTKYRGATILKPNLGEAYAAAKMPHSAPLDAVAEQLLAITDVDLLLITRSEAGMSLFDRQCKRIDFPVQSKEVIDVTGAGDTVLALVCLAMALGIDLEMGAQLANIAAGIAIERLGCVQVSLSDIAQRLLDYDRDTKIFDEEHLYALKKVLAHKRYALLTLEPEHTALEVIRALREIEAESLLVYLNDVRPSEEFVHFLSAMREIDYVLLHNLRSFYDSLTPDAHYTLREGVLVKI
ncbi:MAG: HldE protein [Chlamydiia bacterium]|nr:HldE protein [Chlamydiia bacterium]